MTPENIGIPSSVEAGSAAKDNAGMTGGKAPWTAPLLSRLDGRETQAITPHSPNPGSSKHYTPELFMGS